MNVIENNFVNREQNLKTFSFPSTPLGVRFSIKSKTIVISAGKTKKKHLVHLFILNVYTVMSKNITSRSTDKKHALC